MKQKQEKIVLKRVAVSDEMLVKNTLEDNLTAFEELAKRYYEPLLRHARRYLKDEDEAMDAVQESLVSTYKNLSKFDLKKSFRPWIYRLTGNYCIDVLRKKKKQVPLEIEVADEDESLFDRVAEFGEAEKVRKAVLRLPERYRLPILGFYFQDLSYSQLSRHLHITEATLKTHLFRGKALLKKMMEDEKYE